MRRPFCLCLLALFAGLHGTAIASAQSTSSASLLGTPADNLRIGLSADHVATDFNKRIITSSGDVRLVDENRIILTDRLSFDQKNQLITLPQGGTILDEQGNLFTIKGPAEFTQNFAQGRLLDAHLLTTDNHRFAAAEIHRLDGNKTALYKSIFTSCHVCTDSPNPLWQARAKKIIHDDEIKDLIYEDVTLDFLGLPILYLPFFRHPDPTVTRRSGLLTPTYLSNSILGYGFSQPIHFVLSESQDATLTPYIYSKGGGLLAVNYRSLLQFGRYELTGSVTTDNFAGDDKPHGHIEWQGSFDVFDGYSASTNGTYVSEVGYLKRYGFSDADRLESTLSLSQYRPQGYEMGELVAFQSLRSDKTADEIPLSLAHIEASRIWRDLPFVQGDLTATLSGSSLATRADHDRMTLSAALRWDRQDIILPMGIELRSFAQIGGNSFYIFSDPDNYDRQINEFRPFIGIDMRYPLISQQFTFTQKLEPFVHIVLAPDHQENSDIPNDDSLQVSFDLTSLYADSHFPGHDRWERGLRMAIGVNYDIYFPGGEQLSLSGGQILRQGENTDFSERSGLRDTNSDYVAGVKIDLNDYFYLANQTTFDVDLNIRRQDIDFNLNYDRISMNTSYASVKADPASQSFDDREEILANAQMQITPQLWFKGGARRNLYQGSNVDFNFGLRYANECLAVDLNFERDLTESENAPISSAISLQIQLLGL